MPGRVSPWTLLFLMTALLTAAYPREEGFIVPEKRDWRGMVRRLFSRPERARREIEGGYEAERYVADLRREPKPMMIGRAEMGRHAVRTTLVTQPTPGQKAPWDLPALVRQESPAPVPPPVPETPRRRAPSDAPTIVMDVVRPAIEGDLGRYLASLPTYE